MASRVKRLLDFALAGTGLVLGAPLLVLLALGVKLDSPGRVIFSQPRLGRGGREFRMHKFRKFPDTWRDQGAGVTVAGDVRMTRFGRFLERSKLDELPQLWNILRGEMSFVGPRPESLRFKGLFTGELAEVLDHVPGIFGPNQIALRNESRLYPPDQDPEVFYRTALFPQKARADIAYFRRATLRSDLGLLLRGLWCSLAGAVDWRALGRRHGRALLIDALFIELAWLGANLARFEGLPTGHNGAPLMTGLWLLPMLILPVMALGGSYRGLVPHFSAEDAIRLAMSSFLGWALAFVTLLGLFHRDASIGLLPMAFLASLALMAGQRIVQREHFRRQARATQGDDHARLAVYGAGRRGVALATLLEQGFVRARVAGFLDDDDTAHRGRLVGSRPVLGSERDLETIQSVHRLSQIWTTFVPEPIKRQRLTAWCEAQGVDLVVLPELAAFAALTERRHAAAPGAEYAAEDWLGPVPEKG